MSRDLPGDLEPQPDDKKRRRILGLLDRRSWLFLGMGLAGILTVALIVTADESFAGINGMRAIRALVPDNETNHPVAPSIPVLGGLAAAIHDIAPLFFAPPADPTGPGPGTPSPQPANSPSSSVDPAASGVPAVQQPSLATPSPAATAGPTASPPNSAAPMSPSPSPAPAPNVALATDRGATAIVDLTDLVPGDSMDRTITVQNSGSLAFRYTLSAMQTASTPLWTDATDGLQLTVRTTGGTILYTGPLSGVGFVAGPTTLAPGTSETLRYTFAFPASATNGFQGLIQDLTLVLDAVEFP
ncbi:MAG TPA: hypothetical protein DCK98_13435 [Chloroflexi bacterium]|jgi:hypothetical protein|nr:hypothetical protein [Chloroflexota bacterium]HAL27891.1 hypothetical protein [Chloroflexota bacterium]